ncbi:MAG: type II toxin-antitoxin system HicA family toxin [Clostridia bacterium]|nr:type II toxin-antitoxin system HicA family toxin [Clostridia bacterium]MBN2883344.1 type II toxin-antitoxin system HicA family toxin [Clostridia bacterium]
MPDWKDLKRFLDNDGWELYKVTDHYYYRKKTSDGNLRRTKVSMGSHEIPGRLWKEILKRQLGVSMEYFNKNS